MTTTTKEKENILDFTFHLSETVKREGWISHYDVDSDSFALISPKLSDDARKEYINDEFALYFTKKRDIQGVFIEYFKSNFLKHHKKTKFVLSSQKQKENKQSVVYIKKETIKKFVPELESVLKESLLKGFQIHQS